MLFCRCSRICEILMKMLMPDVLLTFAPVVFATELDTLSREDLRPGVTEISRSIYGLHSFVIWVCVAIAVVVYGVLLYSIYKYRKSKGAQAANFAHSMKAEIIWTLIPIVLLVIMGVPTVKVLTKMYDSQASEIDVLVTGYQWKWSYEYLGEDVRFFSALASDKPNEYSALDQIENNAPKDVNYLLNVDNSLVIPVDTKVRFLVTSNDVLHAWWVPDFAVKRDAIPGYINEAWAIAEEEGTYRGQCAELCGKDHAYMPIVVEVVSKQEYQSWLAAKKAELGEEKESANQVWETQALLGQGEKVYAANCAVCHQVTGAGLPPAFPALVKSAKVEGDAAIALDVVFSGVPGTAMQAFGKQLSDVDIASVLTYIRSSWGNAAAEPVIQPSDVASLR